MHTEVHTPTHSVTEKLVILVFFAKQKVAMAVYKVTLLIDVIQMCNEHGQSGCTAARRHSAAETNKYVGLLLQYSAILFLSVELGDLILHRPSNGWQIFHRVVYKIIQEMQWLPQHVISSTQLLLVLRLETIPDQPG